MKLFYVGLSAAIGLMLSFSSFADIGAGSDPRFLTGSYMSVDYGMLTVKLDAPANTASMTAKTSTLSPHVGHAAPKVHSWGSNVIVLGNSTVPNSNGQRLSGHVEVGWRASA